MAWLFAVEEQASKSLSTTGRVDDDKTIPLFFKMGFSCAPFFSPYTAQFIAVDFALRQKKLTFLSTIWGETST